MPLRKKMGTQKKRRSNLCIGHSTRLAENLRQLGRSHRIRQVPHIEPPSVTFRPWFLWLFLFNLLFSFKQFCLWVFFFGAFIAFFDLEAIQGRERAAEMVERRETRQLGEMGFELQGFKGFRGLKLWL
jgi:hypothetical protein